MVSAGKNQGRRRRQNPRSFLVHSSSRSSLWKLYEAMDATIIASRRYLRRVFQWTREGGRLLASHFVEHCSIQTFKEKAMVAIEKGIEGFFTMGVYIIYFFLSMVFLSHELPPISMIESYLNDIFGDYDDGEYGDLGSDDLSQGDYDDEEYGDLGSDDSSQGEDHDMGYVILRLTFITIMLELMILRITSAIYLIEDPAESYLNNELGHHGDEHDGNCGSECIDLDQDKDHDMGYIILRIILTNIKLRLQILLIIFRICLRKLFIESYLNNESAHHGDEHDENCGSEYEEYESGNISREWNEDETNESGTNNFAAEDGDHEHSSDSEGLSEYEEYDIEEDKKSVEEDCGSKNQDDESSDGNYLAKHVPNNENCSSKINHSNSNNSDEEEHRKRSKDNETEVIGGELSTVFEQLLSSKASHSWEGHDDDTAQFVESDDEAMEESMFTAANHEWLLVDMQNLDSIDDTACSHGHGRLTEGWRYILRGLRSYRN
ncbi:uncharacterized protein [Elaeis guineensis]|uniref:uncharacterized protein isoform X1 n=1 Tax=Elaeis guineensis var. tenera TaxID=51953 RepID=UPI003C6CFD47